MVTMNHQEHLMQPKRLIGNVAHQHAFILVGKGFNEKFDPEGTGLDCAFGVHMTQYHCELHKYQIVMKYRFDFSHAVIHGEPDLQEALEKAKSEGKPAHLYKKLRQEYGDITFFLGNANDEDPSPVEGLTEEFSIPALGNGSVKEFLGNIFFGLRAPTEEDMKKPHFFPWSKDRCKGVIENIVVHCERVVIYRPFEHVTQLPEYALYYIFGEGDEAFMTHIQTAETSCNPFVPKSYGPDYDDVVALKSAPVRAVGSGMEKILDDDLLQAGVKVSIPELPLEVDEEGKKPAAYPIPMMMRKAEPVTVMYRGIGPSFTVTPEHCYLYATVVCNSPDRLPHDGAEQKWTPMPPRFEV